MGMRPTSPRRRPTRTATALAMVLALGLGAAACGDDDDPTTAGGGGTTTTAASDDGDAGTSTGTSIEGAWDLASYVDDGNTVTAPTPAATLVLEAGGSLRGTTGCNSFSGTWSGAIGEPVELALGPMTQRACTDPATDAQERAVTTGLPLVRSATLDGADLVLQGDGVTLTWAPASTSVVGAYAVTGVSTGDAVESSALTEALALELAADGTISGFTGCNRFAGSYRADGTSLTIESDVAATMMACDPAPTAFEQQFLAALAAVATWERTGEVVTLRDAAGAIQLTLVPAAG